MPQKIYPSSNRSPFPHSTKKNPKLNRIDPSPKSLSNTVTDHQLLAGALLEAPPQIRHALVQPRCEDAVDVAEDALVVLERQLTP